MKMIFHQVVLYFFLAYVNSYRVEEPLLAKGWHRIQDRQSDSFKLKWVELKTHINYNNFRPGKKCNVYTTKFSCLT